MGEMVIMKNDQMYINLGGKAANLIPMGRMGSGTSWQPASTDMPMMHKQVDDWLVMFCSVDKLMNTCNENLILSIPTASPCVDAVLYVTTNYGKDVF